MKLINDTVGDMLEKWASETPDSDFIVYPDYGIRWTFKEFNERVDIFAKGLMEMGVTKDTKGSHRSRCRTADCGIRCHSREAYSPSLIRRSHGAQGLRYGGFRDRGW